MSTDFTGFSFDGIHSSRLGIVRVSGGDRYDEGLIPEIDDKTTEIPGNDGEYFFGKMYPDVIPKTSEQNYWRASGVFKVF